MIRSIKIATIKIDNSRIISDNAAPQVNPLLIALKFSNSSLNSFPKLQTVLSCYYPGLQKLYPGR